MISIPSLLIRTDRRNGYTPGKRILQCPTAERPRRSDDDHHRNRVHGKVGRRGVERMEEIQQRRRRRGRGEARHCRRQRRCQ